MGNALNRGSARSNDPDTLVGQPHQAASLITSGILVVPAAGMETVAGEGLDAGNTRQLGLAENTGGYDREARGDAVFAVGRCDPACCLSVPIEASYRRLQQSGWIQAIPPGHHAAKFVDLRSLCIFLGRDVAELLQHRQVDI